MIDELEYGVLRHKTINLIYNTLRDAVPFVPHFSSQIVLKWNYPFSTVEDMRSITNSPIHLVININVELVNDR